MAQEIVNITVVEAAPDVIEITVEEVAGDTGDKGDKGDKGDTGDKGDKGDKGDPGTLANASQSDLLNKLGYATNMSGGALSPSDHISFSSKQPAGAYLTNTSVTRGTYIYHSQATGDTIGDWRQYANGTAFYTQYCTASNSTRGSGIWITKQTINA